MKWNCVVCGETVENYKPEYCCSGEQCGCRGLPIEPPLCSVKCSSKIYGNGETYKKNDYISAIEEGKMRTMKCILYGPCPYEQDGQCTSKYECEMREE